MKQTRFAGDITVSLVACVCVLTLAIVSKYFIDVELDFVSQYGPVWIYITYMITRGKREKSRLYNEHYLWSLAIIIATILILVVYGV